MQMIRFKASSVRYLVRCPMHTLGSKVDMLTCVVCLEETDVSINRLE